MRTSRQRTGCDEPIDVSPSVLLLEEKPGFPDCLLSFRQLRPLSLPLLLYLSLSIYRRGGGGSELVFRLRGSRIGSLFVCLGLLRSLLPQKTCTHRPIPPFSLGVSQAHGGRGERFSEAAADGGEAGEQKGARRRWRRKKGVSRTE